MLAGNPTRLGERDFVDYKAAPLQLAYDRSGHRLVGDHGHTGFVGPHRITIENRQAHCETSPRSFKRMNQAIRRGKVRKLPKSAATSLGIGVGRGEIATGDRGSSYRQHIRPAGRLVVVKRRLAIVQLLRRPEPPGTAHAQGKDVLGGPL
jgi:hypothetical protein